MGKGMAIPFSHEREDPLGGKRPKGSALISDHTALRLNLYTLL